MDQALYGILKLFILYSLPGFFFLWALKDSYRLERFLMGLVLISWAAFALGMTTIATGVLEPLLSDKDSSEYTIKQARDFLPYVSFFSFIYMFLLGGVGTNAISSSLMDKANLITNEEISKFQTQLNGISNKVDNLESFHYKYVVSSVIIFILYVLGAYLASK